MNWLDIKYANDTMKKSLTTGETVPLFSKNLSSDFDFVTTVELYSGHSEVEFENTLGGTCYLLAAMSDLSSGWVSTVGTILDDSRDVVEVSPTSYSSKANITVVITRSTISARLSGSISSTHVPVEIRIKKIF